ncbi:MAG: sulfite exporter TauE/SafE family protein [Candidatus Shapirobacteria bacterium]|nr:sulfite exporter TauE/SafE family protein [Candidatus Shapirobacteria bacterium]
MAKKINSCTYSVSGTHCHSCELIIEKEIKSLPGVKSVSASTKDQKVVIQYKKHAPEISELNKLFKDAGYSFSPALSREGGPAQRVDGFEPKTDIFTSLLIVSGILVAFYFLQKTGIFSSINVNSSSLLPSFFGFGLLAGFSTCAALVGGIVLSLSKQWGSLYSQNDSTLKRLQPVLMFNLGRVVFFALFGAFLGLFGSFLHLSITAGAIVTILVSIIMFGLGLQMLGVKGFSSFQLSLPKSLTGKFSDETKFQGRFMPLIMGGLTFFLPCGFTLTAQSLSLASGNPIQGALIMAFFALGTFIPLLLIGYSSVRSLGNPKTAKYFSQIAGILVLIFALFNLKSQLTVLGFNLISTPTQTIATTDDVTLIDGKQILTMTASAAGYTPNHFKIKANVPVVWNITSSGNAGCAGSIISPQLFPDRIILTPDAMVTKEFTVAVPGTYRFSCSMGMYTGSIEVTN